MGENRPYKQQFGDIYFLRLAKLKPAVVKAARESWEGYNVRRYSFEISLLHSRDARGKSILPIALVSV